jgi:hypothetical protein
MRRIGSLLKVAMAWLVELCPYTYYTADGRIYRVKKSNGQETMLYRDYDI